MVDTSWIDPLIRQYATPVVGAALILAGVFLRLLGKGVAYLMLGVGIVATVYAVFKDFGRTDTAWFVPAVLLGGVAASVSLALALRALTVAVEFGFFTVGWYLILRALPSFASWFPPLSSIPGLSTWMGTSILTTIAAEGIARRFMSVRRPAALTVQMAEAKRSARR